jgi:hypothetical protein
MKVSSILVLATAVMAVPVPEAAPAEVNARQYGSYGDYAPPAGGYGSYGSYAGAGAAGAPPPTYASYGDYAPPGGYSTYGAYKRAVSWVKSWFN